MYGFRGAGYPAFSNALVHSFVAKFIPVLETPVDIHLYQLPSGEFKVDTNGVVRGEDLDTRDLIRAFSCGSDPDFDLQCSINRGHIASLSFNGERIMV